MPPFKPSHPCSRRRGRARAIGNAGVAVLTLTLTLALVACNGTQGLLPSLDSAPAVAPSAAPLPLPDADVVALADQMFLTAEGRAMFYASQPQLADADEIETECAGAGDTGAGDRFIGGCFITTAGQHPDAGRIFVFRPADDRLRESMVTVGAHELLHAAYARFGPGQQAQVDALVAEATALMPADDPVHEQIEWSTGDDAGNRASERFAYLGSQVALEAGIPEPLEDIYALSFADRAALVETHRRASAVIDDALAAVDAAWAHVQTLESHNAQARAQLQADRDGYDAAFNTYTADLERFNATPPEEQARWEVTLRPAGEQPVTMTWEASLTYRREELERFRGELDARSVALAAAEATASSARAEADALQADAMALVQAANPKAHIPH